MPEPPPIEDPTISVVMAVYNGERYLRQAVDSILDQTFTDFELLCIDDGSTDATPEILAAYAARDARVRVLSQANRGLIASLNRGVSEARGGLIARMDDDDVSHPERFDQQVAFLKAHPEVGILGTVAAYSDADGELTGGAWPRWAPPGMNGWNLLFKTNICHPTVLMRREVLDALDDGQGLYRKEALHAEDYELWTRARFVTRIANLPDALLTRRKHDGTIGAQHAERQERTVIETMQQAHERLLERKVPLNEVALVRQLVQRGSVPGIEPPDTSPAHLEAAARLVRDLYDAYTRRFALDAASAPLVRRDAAGKLLQLAERARPASAASYLAIMNMLWRVEPRSVLREVGARLKRKVARA
ncbi:MAG: glycosyltransferase family 2 protein [Bacteroidota bacterium]